MSSLPRLDGDAVRQQILMLQREPFRELLATILSCAPDEDALRTFARKSPDRWMQAIAIAGRMAGYTEKVETRETNLYMQINVLSDSDLRRLHAETLAQLSAVQGIVIDQSIVSPPDALPIEADNQHNPGAQ